MNAERGEFLSKSDGNKGANGKKIASILELFTII